MTQELARLKETPSGQGEKRQGRADVNNTKRLRPRPSDNPRRAENFLAHRRHLALPQDLETPTAHGASDDDGAEQWHADKQPMQKNDCAVHPQDALAMS